MCEFTENESISSMHHMKIYAHVLPIHKHAIYITCSGGDTDD